VDFQVGHQRPQIGQQRLTLPLARHRHHGLPHPTAPALALVRLRRAPALPAPAPAVVLVPRPHGYAPSSDEVPFTLQRSHPHPPGWTPER
jgi:hypothetical protein